MKQSVGEYFTLNIIVLFIVVVFAIISATISYYKAFKVNSLILASIEKFEGYNSCDKGCSIQDITRILNSLGYEKNTGNFSCPAKRGTGVLVANQNTNHVYCVYYYRDDRGGNDKTRLNQLNDPIYYNYSVVSYITINLPVIPTVRIPVNTKGERTYNFSDRNSL